MEWNQKFMPQAVLQHLRAKLELVETGCIMKRVKHHGFIMEHSPEDKLVKLDLPAKFPYLSKIHNARAAVIHGDDHEYPGCKWFLVTVEDRFFYFVQGLKGIMQLEGDAFDLCFNADDLPPGSIYQVAQLTVYACAKCKRLAPHLNACGPCKIESFFYFYCSKECQVADWPAHKLICCKNA
jgi:hypothetical protein